MPYQIETLNYGTAINSICVLVGHPKQQDPVGTTDPAVQQMGAAINNALSELLTMFEWPTLTVKSSIDIYADAAGQKEKAFDMPADFYRFIDQTQWSKATQLPAIGPVSNQAWMQYTVRNYTPQLTLFWQFRDRERQLHVLNPPFPVPVKFEFMYLSNAQVTDADDPTLLKNTASKNGDSFVLDPLVIMLLGRAKYLEWKGFDSTTAMRDFLTVYNSRTGASKGAPILSMSGVFGFPYIDAWANLPDTGYGSS